MQLMQQLKLVFCALSLSVFFVFCACTKPKNTTSELFSEPRHMLWNDPKQCLSQLQLIDTTHLTTAQMMEYHLIGEHATLRAYSRIATDTMSSRLSDYFHANGLTQLEAEAHYLNASEKDFLGKTEDAMFRLKQAEQLLDTTTAQKELIGALYYRMGSLSESDMLYDLANQYYHKALRYLKNTNQHLFLACTYRDLGRTTKDSLSLSRNQYFDQALR